MDFMKKGFYPLCNAVPFAANSLCGDIFLNTLSERTECLGYIEKFMLICLYIYRSMQNESFSTISTMFRVIKPLWTL